MKTTAYLSRAACALIACVGLSASAQALEYSDIAGWWSAEPVHGGESSRIVLHFLQKDGKTVAELSLPAIGVHEIGLGEVTIAANSIDTKSLSFPLMWNATSQTLAGLLPKDAAPLYDIPVEFRRSGPFAKPGPPQWHISKPVQKWTVDVGAPVWAALEWDDESGWLFVGNDAGALHAIDAGVVRWKHETGKPIRGQPRVIGDSVYVASDSGHLYRLNKRSGAEKWRVKIDAGSPERIPTDQPKSRWDRYGSSVVADASRVYVASRDSHLYAIDIDSGREAWRLKAGDMMTATPALHRDLVIFAAFDGKVQAVSAADGKPRWTYDAKLAVPGDLIVANDRVLVGSRTYDLIALDASKGKQLWKRYYWFSWIESPPVVRDGVIYTGSSDATHVYAVNLGDGSLRWKTAVPGWSWQRPAVSDEWLVTGTVGADRYPGFRSGSLVALDRRSGALRWVHVDPPSAEIVEAKKSWGFGAAPVIAQGLVYAADLNGLVHAFELGER